MLRSTTLIAAGVAAVLALTAPLAIAETVVKKKVFETTVTAQFAQTSPAGDEYATPSGTFSGQLTSAKNKCVKSRGVTVKAANGSSVGQATSNSSGAWTLQGANLVPGQYGVEVAKSKIIKEKDKPNGTHVKKKIVCEAGSATVAVP